MVAETLKRSGRSQSANSRRVTVDFPAPLGPEMMIRRGGVDSAIIHAPLTGLFQVLDQFTHPLDRTFDLDHDRRYLGVSGFRTDRVGLSEHLLDDEIQFSAHRLVAPGLPVAVGALPP